MFDLLWSPFFISIFLFSFFFFIVREPVNKILSLSTNNLVNKKIKFYVNNFYDDYFSLIKFMYKFTIYIYILFFINNCYFFSFSNISYFFNFQIFNYIWLYYLIINILILFSLTLLLNYLITNITKSFEFLISIILFFNCLFYYLLMNNLIALIFIFEVQSLIFIYLLATNFSIKLNFNNLYTLKNNNFSAQPIWYFNSLLYQFWVSFIGALLLIYSSLNFFKLTSFNDWWNFESYIYMFYNMHKYYSFLQIFFFFLPLILGLLLKLGSVPFFLWKPEIYKNFNLSTLFIYMVVYSFSSIYFLVVFLSNYIFLLKSYLFSYFYIIFVLSLILVSLLIFSIVEIRPFLAYTSILHIVFILLSVFMDSLNSLSISYFYLFTYLFLLLYLFIILFFCKDNNNIWYFTDLQFFFKNNIIMTGFSVLFISMAGIPPFIGFFAKISLISLLLFNSEYLLFFLTLISGFFISFFYIQNYRFFGYNIKNINYSKNLVILKDNGKLFFYFYIFLFINLFSFLFINDFYIFFTFLSIN